MLSIPTRRLLLVFGSALIITRLINAFWLPAAQDEAYYFFWSRSLDWGYFDHPPMVALLSALGNLHIGSVFLSRLGTFLIGLLSLPVLYSLFQRLGGRERSYLWPCMILACFSAAAVIQGYVTTPDIPMVFCWILALHEAAAALDDKPKRWLSAGLFTGLGFYGKYTMALIGPVFLVALLANPKKLKERWPYLGALVCILTLLPHLLWLQQHDWVTLRFQFGRGLKSVYTIDMQTGTDLPKAVEPAKDGVEFTMSQYFKLPDDEISQPKPPKTAWQKYRDNVSEYLGSQLGLWGLLILPILAAIIMRQRRTHSWRKPELKALAFASFLVPLLLFGLLSPFQNIEANWPAMYLIGASAIIAQSYRLHEKALLWAAAGNLFITLLLSFHIHFPIFSQKPHKDRLLKESHGYEELAAYLKNLPGPVLVDTYQNTSQIAFYAPSLKVQQWPGVARTSELIRRAEFNPWRWQALQKEGGFYLLMDNFVPPHIPGTEISQLSEILDCVEGGLKITPWSDLQAYTRPCQKRVHRWSLAYYSILSAESIEQGS